MLIYRRIWTSAIGQALQKYQSKLLFPIAHIFYSFFKVGKIQLLKNYGIFTNLFSISPHVHCGRSCRWVRRWIQKWWIPWRRSNRSRRDRRWTSSTLTSGWWSGYQSVRFFLVKCFFSQKFENLDMFRQKCKTSKKKSQAVRCKERTPY